MAKQTLSDKEILDKFKSQLNKELVESEPLLDLLLDWIQGRREARCRMTTGAVKIAVNKLNKHPVDVCISAVTEAVEKSYRGVFPDNHAKRRKPEPKNTSGKPPSDNTSALAILGELFDNQAISGFNGFEYPENIFFEEIYRPARRLGFIEKPKELATSLFSLITELNKIRREAEEEPTERFKYCWSPRMIMEFYIKWLGEQPWLSDIRLSVFNFDSSIFQSFIRKESKKYNNGYNILYGDPI